VRWTARCLTSVRLVGGSQPRPIRMPAPASAKDRLANEQQFHGGSGGVGTGRRGCAGTALGVKTSMLLRAPLQLACFHTVFTTPY
jgi:hypothetical protein